MRFQKHDRAWYEMTRSPTGMVGSYYRREARRIEFMAKRQVGKESHKLEKSINHSLYSFAWGILIRVGSDNSIAYIHHEGTKPHVIIPKTAKTLRFSSRGKIVYAKVVKHPGTKPNRYLSDNMRKVIR